MLDILPELNDKDYIAALTADYDIRFCQKHEVDELVEFIDKHWKKSHIFVLSRKLLDWQHYDRKNGQYNFVIARHKPTGEIHSILGFVPTSQFDQDIKNVEVWPCIWKSRDDIHRKGLGVSLYYYLKAKLNIETISILGISEIALSIYKHWGFTTGKIEQFYLPNALHSEDLTQNRQFYGTGYAHKEGWSLRKLSQDEYESLSENNALFDNLDIYKSKRFFVNRYFKHPIYKYYFIAIQYNEQIMSIAITRECGNGTSTCLRIVDFIGSFDSLSCAISNLEVLMIQNNYEYIDFVVTGAVADAVKRAGFINRKDNPQTIIPNYFEPFLKENVDLDYAYKTINPVYTFSQFKADADQDRPNMLL